MTPKRTSTFRLWVTGFSLVCLLTACAGGKAYRAPSYTLGATQRGIASWYGPGFHGRKTANGETYNMHKVTAAHRTLPMGSLVEVRSLTTGKTVRVRINDRGPFVKGRIIDLSLGAARQLGIVGKGTDRVEITILRLGNKSQTLGPLWVQVGSFASREDATQFARKVEPTLRRVRIVSVSLENGKWYRVQMGPYSTDKEAEAIAERMANEWGISPFVLRES